MRAIALVTALAVATPALAQPLSQPVQRYGDAPWWMAQPIIAAVGHVETELPANRARFSANFQVTNRTAAEATRLAAEKVRVLAQSLAALGADKVRVQTSFSQRPIFEQYRDRSGNLQDNAREDKIDAYAVDAILSIEVRDPALTERVYNAVVASQPTSTGSVQYSLEAADQAQTELFGRAVADARRRAELAATGAGGQLGAVKLIDPTGRACQTDVLITGAPNDGLELPPSVQARMAPPPAPPPPPRAVADALGALPAFRGAGGVEQPPLPVQPPQMKLYASACVIYGLRG